MEGSQASSRYAAKKKPRGQQVPF